MPSRNTRSTWLSGGLAAMLVIVIGYVVTPEKRSLIEAAFYDRVLRTLDTQPATRVVHVTADAESLDKLGPLPWSPDVHATLIERLHMAGAGVIAFTRPVIGNQQEAERLQATLKLLESSEGDTREQARKLRELLARAPESGTELARLARAISTHAKVVLPLSTTDADLSGGVPGDARVVASSDVLHTAVQVGGVYPVPSALSRSASAMGHTYFEPDADGTVRRDIALLRVGTALVPSLATAIALTSADQRASDLRFENPEWARVGNRRLRLDDHLTRLPHPLRDADIRSVSYTSVLSGALDHLAGALVFVTPAHSDDAQMLRTPVGLQSEATWIASATVSLLDDSGFERSLASRAASLTASLLMVLLCALLIPRLSAIAAIVLSLAVVIALVTTELAVLASAGLWLQLITPALALLIGVGMHLLARTASRLLPANNTSRDDGSSLRALGQTFQKQGQLDLAFETLRRCPIDTVTMDLLYTLGHDYEKRHQYPKALAVYSYMGTHDPGFRDLRVRRAQVIRQGTEHQKQLNASRVPEPPTAPPAPAVEDDDFSPRSFHTAAPGTGRKLGRYEIERELGKGAMGVVYLGRDPKINRVVAIKAIPLAEEFQEEDLAEARARFFREAEMAGRLNHPAIVTVYDAGEDQGLAYIAMEYLRGQHLSHFADASRLLPPKSVMMLAARVAEALHYAHRQNVVHRDIKPANIMFNPDTDELKITDFGIARLTDVSRTKTGIVLGTPSFMSPEQLEGRSLDGRSDLFALGVSLYQLLTGQLPFRADSMPRLMQKIATEPHTPIESMRSDLPAGIPAIIDRALAKSQEARYPTGTEFAAALRACAQSEDVQW